MYLFKRILPIFVSILVLVGQTGLVYGLSPEQKQLYERNILYYDLESCSEVSGTSLSGSDNEEKVWNYFKGKGLDDHLVAGIMGNISQESTFEPERIQDPPGGTTKDPSGISAGWGLIQWTPGSKILGIAQQANITGPVYELSVQLDIIWWHVTDTSPRGFKNVLPEFKKAKNPKEAASAWEYLVEGAGKPMMQNRWAAAEAAMAKYGGSVSASTAGQSTSSTNCECGTQSNNLTGRLAELAEENGGKTQISVAAIKGKNRANYGGSVQMPTRSSYKIYTAYATLRAIEEGKISWGTSTSWQGKSVEDTMEAMIVKSSNGAAEALRTNNKIGNHREVTDLLQNQVGLSDKTIMGSGRANDSAGSNSKSTANDFTKFLTLLHKEKLPGVEKSSNYNKLISFMKKATTDEVSARDGIAKGVGNTEVADKPGWADGDTDPVSNDVGIVYLKDNPYVISILTDKPNQWGGVEKIAKEVHSIMRSGGVYSGSACSSSFNGNLSAAVQAYAWPDYSSSKNDPKPEYKKAYDSAVSKGQYGGGGYTDCGAFVSRVMIDTGYEPEYNFGGEGGNTRSQREWLQNNWKKVSVSSTKDLKMGDVAIHSTHTYMYVGEIAGFNGDSASASLDARVPMASNYYDGFEWYRKK